MKNNSENLDILPSKKQLHLYGYKNFFDLFIKLFNKKKLPNTILLSGPKGSGKATFAYHFINYALSLNEEGKYLLDKFEINPDNKSYVNLCNNTHPNFFLIENNINEENIKIDTVRNIFNFLNKTTYNSSIKIVMIDNAEYLNINSSNALLKILEEPGENTFFFIVHNSEKKILNTIKSRCMEFRIYFDKIQKNTILTELIKQYDNAIDIENIDDKLYLNSPGNIFKYIKILNDNNIESIEDKLSCIFLLINKFKTKKDPELLTFIMFLIELFYNDLSLKNTHKLSNYFYNKFKILNQINDMKKFNLDKNNLFISLQGILKNER